MEFVAAWDAATLARRRRHLQLRAWHRHVRTTVTMELATALHHSAQPAGLVVVGSSEGEVRETYDAPQRLKAPLPGKRPGVPRAAVTGGYGCRGSSLADAARRRQRRRHHHLFPPELTKKGGGEGEEAGGRAEEAQEEAAQILSCSRSSRLETWTSFYEPFPCLFFFVDCVSPELLGSTVDTCTCFGGGGFLEEFHTISW